MRRSGHSQAAKASSTYGYALESFAVRVPGVGADCEGFREKRLGV